MPSAKIKHDRESFESLLRRFKRAVEKDGVMQEKYDRIKARSGAKRAIVAIARTLLLRTRRMLLDGTPYAIGTIS